MSALILSLILCAAQITCHSTYLRNAARTLAVRSGEPRGAQSCSPLCCHPHASSDLSDADLSAECQGKIVTVQTRDGKEYEGILQSCMTEKEMGVILALVRQKVAPDDPAAKPVNEMVFLAKDYVQVTASDTDLFEVETGAARKNMGEVLADTDIEVLGRSAVGRDRELLKATAWLGDGTTQEELTSTAGAKSGWDQFACNELQYGIRSTYHEEMYTTKLSNKKFTEEQLRNAERIAREIESKPATSAHVAEERGQIALHDEDMDEEDKYSTVLRPGQDMQRGGEAWAQPQPPLAAPTAPATPMDSSAPPVAALAPAKPSKLRATASAFFPGGGDGGFGGKSIPAGPGFGAAPYASPTLGGAGYPQGMPQPTSSENAQSMTSEQQLQQQQQLQHQQQLFAVQAQQHLLQANMSRNQAAMQMGQMMMMPPQMQMMMCYEASNPSSLPARIHQAHPHTAPPSFAVGLTVPGP